MIKNRQNNLLEVKNILAYGGYSGENFANEIHKIINLKVEITKQNELNKFVVLLKKWIVERPFAWLEKCRRLWKNCEKLLDSAKAMIELCFIRLLISSMYIFLFLPPFTLSFLYCSFKISIILLKVFL